MATKAPILRTPDRQSQSSHPSSPASPDAGGETRHAKALAGEAGQRLDRVLARALPDLSRTRLKALIEAGHVGAEGSDERGEERPDGCGAGTIAEPSYRVKPGQNFAIFVPHSIPAIPAAQEIALTIVYEDQHLLVINKQAGLVVHPAPGNADGTLVNALIAHCGDSLSGIGGVRRPGILHRLDKDTSGLMIVAKTDAAHKALATQLEARRITRLYTALVWGRPSPRAGQISGRIGRDPRNRKRMAVVQTGGKEALTHYRTVRAAGGTASQIECKLATGRTHQIRLHLMEKGHPVIGDPVYGGVKRAPRGAATEAAKALGRQALHAHGIVFAHPQTGAPLAFEVDLPKDMKELLDCLERL